MRQHADDIGWRHVVIDPLDLRDVASADLAFASPYGRYEVSWRRAEDGIRHLRYAAPPGAVVEVRGHPGQPLRVEEAQPEYGGAVLVAE
ncbi:alpha-L-rhamnosidase C-terminal domain-containing protein [Glycomyces sp. NPDC021274]|uniref:alpha-L-rhamnosidase C-terminal domain-containing protein n=1 Tax=Glycomyces sp. NPDC021274 TaxID=3155120 RepID=UPI0033E79405